MMANLLTALQIALSLAVLFVAIGRWGGKLEQSASAPPRRPFVDPPDASGSNGLPTFGEVVRRLDDLKRQFDEDRRNYMPAGEANARFQANAREHEDVWGALKDLRTADAAIGRRIDGLMGAGNS